jgi:ABC-type amino acid transport substrate-binding protein
MSKYPTPIKLFFIVSLMLHCLCTNASAENAAPEKLTIGFFDIPPHAYPPTEKVHGTSMQFFDQVAAQMGVEVEYVYYPLAHVLFMLESNRIDAVLMLAKNEARSKDFVYPSAPMFTVIPAIAVLSNSELKTIDQVVNTDSLVIGVWRGGYHSPTLDKNKNTIIELTGNNIASRGLEILARGKIDALFSPDSESIVYTAKKNDMGKKITIFPITNEPIEVYSVFSKKSAKTYLKRYEDALAKVKNQTTYEAILKQHTIDNP